jgi:AraC-like DNA-binding protein
MSAEQSLTTNQFGHWVEEVCRTYVALNVAKVDDSPFRAGLDITHLGDTVLAELHATALRADRRPAEIARSAGDYAILILQQSGTMIVAQDGRDVRLVPGAATVVDTTRPYTLYLTEPVRQIVLHCPRHQLESRVRSMRAVTAACIAGGSPTGALLAGTLVTLARERRGFTPPEAEAVGRYALDLLATSLEATPEARAAVFSRGSAALMTRINAFLRDNLADPGLSPTRIAEAHGISVRHVHRLFHESGDSVGAAIRRFRLDRCRADLEDPRQRARSVTAIALRWGFNDSAHFSRVFRARFGLAPRAVRRSYN